MRGRAILAAAVLALPLHAGADSASAMNTYFDACLADGIEAATDAMVSSGMVHYRSRIKDQEDGFVSLSRGRELTFSSTDGTLFARLRDAEGVRESGLPGRQFSCLVTCNDGSLDRASAEVFGGRIRGAGGARRPFIAGERDESAFDGDGADIWIWQWRDKGGDTVQAGYYLGQTEGRAVTALTLYRDSGS